MYGAYISQNKKIVLSLKLEFYTIDNVTKYEAPILRLQIEKKYEILNFFVF